MVYAAAEYRNLVKTITDKKDLIRAQNAELLASLTSVQRLERDVLSGRQALLVERVSLYRALGGTWTDELVAPNE